MDQRDLPAGGAGGGGSRIRPRCRPLGARSPRRRPDPRPGRGRRRTRPAAGTTPRHGRHHPQGRTGSSRANLARPGRPPQPSHGGCQFEPGGHDRRGCKKPDAVPEPAIPQPTIPELEREGRKAAVPERAGADGTHGLEPGELIGYGPISASQLAEIVAMAGADFDYCSTVTRDGQVVFHQRTRYRPTRRQRGLINARDRTCCHPGCTRRAASCDADHVSHHRHGGPTCVCNLIALCRRHHRAKHEGQWWWNRDRTGGYAVQSPLGHTYLTPTRAPTRRRRTADPCTVTQCRLRADAGPADAGPADGGGFAALGPPRADRDHERRSCPLHQRDGRHTVLSAGCEPRRTLRADG